MVKTMSSCTSAGFNLPLCITDDVYWERSWDSELRLWPTDELAEMPAAETDGSKLVPCLWRMVSPAVLDRLVKKARRGHWMGDLKSLSQCGLVK